MEKRDDLAPIVEMLVKVKDIKMDIRNYLSPLRIGRGELSSAIVAAHGLALQLQLELEKIEKLMVN